MKALALDDKVLLVLGLGTSGLGHGLGRSLVALALSRPRLFPKNQATWLLYVYALLPLTVSHDSLPFCEASYLLMA